MRSKLITLLVLASLLLAAGSALGQDGPEWGGRNGFPFQYTSQTIFEAETGMVIDSYGEAPMLADKVAAGELPPVEERLPSDPVVVQALESIGVYGGELAGPSMSPTGAGWDVLEMRLQKLLTIDTDLNTIIPNVAKELEISDDLMTYTIHLREGHKWSDGTPFTSEDFRFYFEDFLSNEELSPAPSGAWVLDRQLPVFEVVDETTVRYTFHRPYPSLPIQLGSEVGHRGYIPAHYFKQFHIDYNENANELAAEQGFEDWLQLFNSKKTPYNNTWNLGAETDAYSPTLNSFVFVSEDSFGNKLYERNPYFFKVDIEGNQLPYTDTLRRILVEDLQVQDLKAIAGEYSHFGWGSLLNFPVYKDNEEAGGYRAITLEYARGNEYVFVPNFTYDDPVLREIFWDVRFRQALSLAINRDEINELVYFGLARPSQVAPHTSSVYYEDWMGDYYAQFDPDEANRLLDEIGLDQRDSDGYRLRPDGETLFINLQLHFHEESWQKITELVTSHWEDVGIKVNLKVIDTGLMDQFRNNNGYVVGAHGWGVTDISAVANNMSSLRAPWAAISAGVPWEDWLLSDGEEGEEPPEEIKELYELSEAYLQLPYGSEEQIALGRELYKMALEPLYMIGTIQGPPQPLLFKSNLMNTPPADTEAGWEWSYRQWVQFLPETWYFAE